MTPTHLSMSHEGIVERLRSCANGLFWPEARDAIAEIERLQRELSTARRTALLEAAEIAEEVAVAFAKAYCPFESAGAAKVMRALSAKAEEA